MFGERDTLTPASGRVGIASRKTNEVPGTDRWRWTGAAVRTVWKSQTRTNTVGGSRWTRRRGSGDERSVVEEPGADKASGLRLILSEGRGGPGRVDGGTEEGDSRSIIPRPV